MVTLDPITGGNFGFRATAVGDEKTSGSRDDADVIAGGRTRSKLSEVNCLAVKGK
jgi:hypothetical protein